MPSLPPTARYLPSVENLMAHTAFFLRPEADASGAGSGLECIEASSGLVPEWIEWSSCPFAYSVLPFVGGGGGAEMKSSWARKSLPKSLVDLPLDLTCGGAQRTSRNGQKKKKSGCVQVSSP